MLTKLKPKSEFSRNVLTLMTGTTIAQAIPIAISPILTRIYTPEDFGVFALFLAIVGFFSTVSSARYEQALMAVNDNEEIINIFALSSIIILSLTILLFSLIFFFESQILLLLGIFKLDMWIYFMPIAVLFIGFFNLLTQLNNKKKYYKDIANAIILKSIILGIVQLSIGFIKSGAIGLISGQIISSLFGNIKLLQNVFKDKALLLKIEKRKMISLAKEHKKFPFYQLPQAVVGSLSSNMPIYMFSTFFNSSIVGFYSLSTRIVFTPLMLLASSSAKVYNENVAQLYNENGDSYGLSVKLLQSLIKIIMIPFLLLVIFAPHIFAFVFGENWREAGYYTQILSPWLMLDILVTTVAFIPSLVGMQKKAFFVSIIHLLLSSFSITIGILLENVYIALILFSILNSLVLLYNLNWMLKKLKEHTFESTHNC